MEVDVEALTACIRRGEEVLMARGRKEASVALVDPHGHTPAAKATPYTLTEAKSAAAGSEEEAEVQIDGLDETANGDVTYKPVNYSRASLRASLRAADGDADADAGTYTYKQHDAQSVFVTAAGIYTYNQQDAQITWKLAIGFGGNPFGDSGMLVDPNDPRWGPVRVSPPDHPSIGGARFDPYGPPGVPGFEPSRFIRDPKRGPGGHPDLQHFPSDDN